MIGADRGLPLLMDGALPPDLQGTLVRVGPGAANGAAPDDSDEPPERGALHAVELRDGQAVTYRRHASPADAGVFWHAGAILALPERGLPFRYSRHLEPEDFAGGLTVPIASHVRRDATDGSRVLFAVDDGTDGEGGGDGVEAEEEHDVWLRFGEWDAGGALRRGMALSLERATWQHDIGLTSAHIVFIESPTQRLRDPGDVAVPFGWLPDANAWLGTVRRDGDGSDVRWARLDPCLVTHVLGAHEVPAPGRGAPGGVEAGSPELVVYVCVYDAPEHDQPVDTTASVVGPAGVALTSIGGGLGSLERWRIVGDRVERTQLDDRAVEYPRLDAACEAKTFRYGYAVEVAWDGTGVPARRAGVAPGTVVDRGCHGVGLLQFDLDRDVVASWSPGPGLTCTEPLFVRAEDGRSDDEGWLLTLVDDPDRGASDLYVLDASALGRRRPEAVIHLPERLPARSHGEWVPAGRYR
ncbi:MAG TPA: carotenoid oxygenase family protein [Acidimicrobiales bacterium]|nr:carotenoid oxygenase family protein [Acidimicrobiales bacterium]